MKDLQIKPYSCSKVSPFKSSPYFKYSQGIEAYPEVYIRENGGIIK